MTFPIFPRSFGCFTVAVMAIAAVPSVLGQARSDVQLLESLSAGLRVATASEVQAATIEVGQALGRLRKELSEQAVGVVVGPELQLDKLDAELRKVLPDEPSLKSVERSLRRILPGKVQRNTDDLRAKVASLIRLIGLTPAKLDMTRQSIATIHRHFENETLRLTTAGENELRTAFAELATYHPSDLDIELLRKRLAVANFASLTKRDYVTTVSQQRFDVPIDFRECKEGTSIVGVGKVSVALSLELPVSSADSHLRVNAVGTGQVGVSADRKLIHVRARISPQIRAQQSLHVHPSKVTRDTPTIEAHVRTQLTHVNIDCLLGRLPLTERVASRAVQKRLSASDPTFSEQIEKTAREQIEKEGLKLENRINALIKEGMWDLIESLDYEPDVRLWNDAQGIRGEAHLVNKTQLGGLSKIPDVPADKYQSLDLITWVHESAANNILDSYSGVQLDEATVRGLWETELNMTCEDWKNLPPARIPAAITLADQSPLEMRFVPNGVALRLMATSCEIDGQVADEGLRDLRIFYRIDDDADGTRFSRDAIVFPSGLSPEKVAVWTKTLDLFFGKTIRPMPTYGSPSISSYLRLSYFDLSKGWLVVGASRATASSGLGEQLSQKVSR